jgi:hypothetical protein
MVVKRWINFGVPRVPRFGMYLRDNQSRQRLLLESPKIRLPVKLNLLSLRL